MENKPLPGQKNMPPMLRNFLHIAKENSGRFTVGHLCAMLAFVLLLSLEAVYVTNMAFLGKLPWRWVHVRDHIFPPVFFACALFFAPRIVIQVCVIFQFCLSVFIVSYVTAMGSAPSLTTLYHGTGLLQETGDSLFSYVSPLAVAIFALSLAAKCRLAHVAVPPRLRAVPFILFLTCFLALAVPRFMKTSMTLDNPPGHFANPILREIRRNGYLAAWAKEFFSGKYADYAHIFNRTECDAVAVRGLPGFAPGRGIVLIQVESLDYSAVNAVHNDLPVAPTLARLAADGLFLRMDGTKRLGSANSDFELLNSQVTTRDVLYYAFIREYPDSVILPLASAGYEAMVFHGLQKNYMELGTVYPKMGFQRLFFAEELVDAGYVRRENMFMRQVPDADLFAFASSHVLRDKPFFHFIITITMHGALKEALTQNFADSAYYDALHYFDTALAAYLDTLDDGTMIIIYGDHQSYNGPARNRQVPFIVYVKGEPGGVQGGEQQIWQPDETVFSRCELSHYLRRLFLQARPFGAATPIQAESALCEQ